MDAMPDAGTVRSFHAGDIPRVSELFCRTFRSGAAHRQDEVASAIEATYLGSPAYAPEHGSIVHVDPAGRIDGFMGVINISLRIGERRLRAGVLGAYMAEDPRTHPGIGVSLARAVLARRLDVVFSDTANRTSLDISRALRYRPLPLQSLEWTKVLRPAGTAAHLLGRRRPLLRRCLAPLAAALDAALPRVATLDADPRSIVGATDRTIDAAGFAAVAGGLLDGYALRPAWDEAELAWLMGQAALQTKNGPLHVREVLDARGRRAGLYLLYARKGAVAHALQILAEPGRESMVVGSLIAMAKRLGAAAVRGAASREAVLGLTRQPGVFYRHLMSAIIWTQDEEAAAAIRAGDVFLGGLAGETWTRIFADSFV
jgi:hypothetical protein